MIEPSKIAFVADIRLRAVGLEEAIRSPSASVTICVVCADLMAKGDEPPHRTQPLNHIVFELLQDMIANDATFSFQGWIELRRKLRLPIPSMAEPKILRAWNELRRTMSLPAVQTIDGVDGEGKGLVKIAG